MYVMSLRSYEKGAGRNLVYSVSNEEEEAGALPCRPDLALGGSCGAGRGRLLGGLHKYWIDFYIDV